jgi:adenosylcobyric acid synthase
MSNAGKSLLTAALCRIFRQDGYSCAPFKSQNMALNSFITEDGLEMGRAQVMQAEAAGIEPSVLMNPILLKPTTDVGAQVIVNGEVYGNMTAADYFNFKKKLVPDILKAYNSLSEKYDIIVIEGAGSPAEINLKENDIVNMGMARLAKAPVLLVGDIDRGGVFAQLLGTLMLLDDDENHLIKGLVINKFRGDKSILQSGLDMLEQKCSKPIIGVIPYIRCDIEDEDSLSEKLENTSHNGLLDIAVIRLPHISNFTDFDVFNQYSGVNVRYVSSAAMLKFPDMVIVPGTKSTIADLKWLRQCGLEAAIKKLASGKTCIFGICGGYQMLGKTISDNECSESNAGESISGMGLLDISTKFKSEKQRTRISGQFCEISGIFSGLTNAKLSGYEIHMGISDNNEKDLTVFSDGKADGAQCGNIYGSYVHGIFDSGDVSHRIVSALYESKGMAYNEASADRESYKEMQYNKLADEVRANISMKMITK